jgi:hypothetical protein
LTEYPIYQTHHVDLNDASNFLIQISDKPTCDNLKEKILFINLKWKQFKKIFDNTEGKNLAIYLELENGCNSIRMWLERIEALIQAQYRCDSHTLVKYRDELNDFYGTTDKLESNIANLFRLLFRLQNDNNFNIEYFSNDLECSKTKLLSFKEAMPSYLENLRLLLSRLDIIENSLKQIEYWMIDGDAIIKQQPDQLNFEQILQQIEVFNVMLTVFFLLQTSGIF